MINLGEQHQMAVSKKLRFEIFRRDEFACRYCGASAMADAVLEIDHVVPKTLGGRDEPRNLITACEPCNSGKGDTSLDAATIEDVPVVLDESDAWSTGFQPEVELAAWVEDLEMSAAIAWCRNWTPGPTGFSQFGVSVALAIAAGYKTPAILAASEAAGETRDTDLFAHLSQSPTAPEEPPLEQAYDDALERLSAFVPSERRLLIWHARRLAGDYQPTYRELIRAAAEVSHALVEHGRDREALRLYLSNLPGNRGSTLLIQATADWDAVWDDQRGHSAHECPDEVLELAVTFALGATVRV